MTATEDAGLVGACADAISAGHAASALHEQWMDWQAGDPRYVPAKREIEAGFERFRSLVAEIVGVPAVTSEGIRAKAAVALVWLGADEDALVLSLLKDVLAVCGA